MNKPLFILLKGGAGSGWFNPENGGTHTVSGSRAVTTQEQAKAYWEAHFDNGQLHQIDCKYGKRRYVFHVEFKRNHAYTNDNDKTGRDEKRAFDLQRAQRMDDIWHVLKFPKAVTWSTNNSKNKQFDAECEISGDFGRVILEPTPTPEDIKRGVVTHFDFVSWHPVTKASHKAALLTALDSHVSPDKMKKALSEDRASLLGTHNTITCEHAPTSEGIPFNWQDAFAPGHYRKSFDSNRDTESKTNHSVKLLFIKALSVPADAHWITVHPHGEGKGVPVLVQETKKGSGTFHVIGGAGGKLNYLKLHGLKDPKDYAKESAERAKSRRLEAKAQREQDAKLGLTDDKKAAKAQVSQDKHQHEQEFIKTVAHAMGWDDDALSLDDEANQDLSEAARTQAKAQRHRELLKRAREAVGLQRKRLLIDADARRSAFDGSMPLFTDDATILSVQDLDPVRQDSGLGFDAAYKERAEAAGATDDAINAEAAQVAGASSSDPGKAAERADTAKRIKAELEAVNNDLPDLPARIVDVHQAVELLKAEKQLKAIQQAARIANKSIDYSDEPKAYPLQVSDADASDVEKDVADKLRTIKTQAFLGAVNDAEQEGQSLVHHVTEGAYNSLNSLSLVAGGRSMLDRSVVDVLGVQGAAQVLAHRLQTDLSPEESGKLADELEAFHVQHYEKTSTEALAHVAELQEQAASMDLGEASGGDDLLVKAELNRKRVKALEDAQKVLGRSLGEMEANAATVFALREKGRDSVQVSLGKVPAKTAIRALRAIGLQQGDYALEQAGSGTFATINKDGMARLATPVDRENVERLRRNLDIMQGKQDQDGWMPQGFADRADLAMNLPEGVAESLATPFVPGSDLEQSLKEYIGGRAADGDKTADIVADIQSADFFQKVGDSRAAEYRQALDTVAPNKLADGKSVQRAEELSPLFDQYADDYVQSKWGGTRSTLNKQSFDVDDVAQDALHRALSAEPAGVAAYKPIGELTDADRRSLRNYFYDNVAKESAEHAQLRADLESHLASAPEKSTTDMFGDKVVNPNWQAWDSARAELVNQVKSTGLGWPDYAKTMRGQENAYASLQDIVRSKVSTEFAKAYNRLKPETPLKVGRTVIRNNLNHLDAIDPAARDARLKSERQLIDGLRSRIGGKYASGSVADKLDAHKEKKAAFEQAQMGFFSSDALPAESKTQTALAADERHTIGHAAERKIASMMGIVGKNFVPGQPVKLFHASMSGKDGAVRQRAIKFVKANKRAVLGLGVGTGKTGIGLGSFSDLHSEGKIKKGVFVVPSIVQGQFGAEALRFLKPGQFKWHCQPGASHEERLAAYKDPENHFSVVTHQSFRDDVLKIAAKHEKSTPDEVAKKLDAMSQPDRKAFIKSVMDKEGIRFDFAMADEGHGLLNREGKENSRMSNAVQGITDNADYYLHASADPVKNDASEAFDLLAKMDAGRYNDRAAFMRKYGGDSVYAQDGLRRELARHAYTASIQPNVGVDRQERKVELSDSQKAAMDAVDRQVAKARIAKMQGNVDIDALKQLSPSSFQGADESQHKAIAESLTKALGVIHGSALNRVINAHPDSAKLDEVSKIVKENKGKTGVVFARSLEAVKQLKQRLEADGHRVVLVTGKDSSKEKAGKIRAFNPDSGDRKADIIICSDAGAVGANLQSGAFLAQYDTPDTAMVHAQRNGRIHRTGQKQDIRLYDLVANHPAERRARERLARKNALREVVTSPFEGLDDTGLAAFIHHKQVAAAQAELY